MALPKETVHRGADIWCDDCETNAVEGVCKSAGGWYIGYSCKCGPFTKESVQYYSTYDQAFKAWVCNTWTRR